MQFFNRSGITAVLLGFVVALLLTLSVIMPSGRKGEMFRVIKSKDLEQPQRSTSWNLNLIDQVLERLDDGKMAFGAPESMKVGETAEVVLLVNPSSSLEDLKAQITVPGHKEAKEVKVSENMAARLTGSKSVFEITPAHEDDIQPVSKVRTTRWIWIIKALEPGEHKLVLTLSAVLSLDGKGSPRTLGVFRKTIPVELTLPDRLSAFIGSNWQWLWTALLVPVVGWLWTRYQTSSKKRARKSKRR